MTSAHEEQPHVSPQDWDSLRELLLECGPYLDLVERRVAGAADPPRMPRGGLDRAQSVFRTMRLLATTFGLPPVGNLAREMERVVAALRNGDATDDMWGGVRYAISSVRALLRFVDVRAGSAEGASLGGRRARGRRRPGRDGVTAAAPRRRPRRPPRRRLTPRWRTRARRARTQDAA
jgi:hypothetical protein